MAVPQLSNERRFPRIAVGVEMRFRALDCDREQRHYFNGIARNASFGGIFIATDRPAPRGSVVSLEFNTEFDPDGAPDVRAKGVVRWTRKFLHPRGMGVEFIEFEGLGQRQFNQWIEKLLES